MTAIPFTPITEALLRTLGRHSRQGYLLKVLRDAGLNDAALLTGIDERDDRLKTDVMAGRVISRTDRVEVGDGRQLGGATGIERPPARDAHHRKTDDERARQERAVNPELRGGHTDHGVFVSPFSSYRRIRPQGLAQIAAIRENFLRSPLRHESVPAGMVEPVTAGATTPASAPDLNHRRPS